MFTHRLRNSLTLAALLISSLSAPLAHAQALRPPSSALPTLDAFVLRVMNGNPDQLRGAYAPGLFASDVVPQPEGYPGFISRADDVLTQFGSASEVGSIGLLAHDYLAGRDFPLLEPGQLVHLVYGDGRLATYRISQSLRYRALQPRSAHSDFEYLAGGGRLGAAGLFSAIYARPGALVLQTCIEADGLPMWGRLFVVALPYSDRGYTRHVCETCE
jgi:hypothetical protein